MEEERKILEKKQYKIETEYENMKKYHENKFKECISKDGLSQEEQQDCYKRKHQNLAKIETEKSKEINRKTCMATETFPIVIHLMLTSGIQKQLKYTKEGVSHIPMRHDIII